MRSEGIGHLKISKYPTGNRTRNFPPCGAVPQPTAARHRFYEVGTLLRLPPGFEDLTVHDAMGAFLFSWF
jgi:hypothetical protein